MYVYEKKLNQNTKLLENHNEYIKIDNIPPVFVDCNSQGIEYSVFKC